MEQRATWCQLLGMAPTETQLLTTRQATELLQVSRFTLYRLVEAGEIPALRVGGQLRFDRAEILDHLRANTAAT